jgi:hypothetical protein
MWKRFFWANGWRWCPQGTTWNHHMNPDRKMYQDSSPVMLDTVWWRSRQQCSRRYRIFASSVPKQSPKCGYITFFEHNVSWRRPEEVWSKILVGGFKHEYIIIYIYIPVHKKGMSSFSLTQNKFKTVKYTTCQVK